MLTSGSGTHVDPIDWDNSDNTATTSNIELRPIPLMYKYSYPYTQWGDWDFGCRKFCNLYKLNTNTPYVATDAPPYAIMKNTGTEIELTSDINAGYELDVTMECYIQ